MGLVVYSRLNFHAVAVAFNVIEVLAGLLGQAGRGAIQNAPLFLADAVVAFGFAVCRSIRVTRIRSMLGATGHGVGVGE